MENKKIAFTLCSNNYLAQAKALGQSLLRYNPDYVFIVGLVDLVNKDESSNFPFILLEAHSIGIPEFDRMCERYSIVELNTAVKPFYIDFFFRNYNGTQIVMYFDPDILVFDNFNRIEKELDENDIYLTPHFTTPIDDDFLLNESDILNAGLYNLGFIAVKRSDNVIDFLTWWKKRLATKCYIDFCSGLFVDQLWINLVPLFFRKVFVSYNPGCNLAYWNLHERTLSLIDGRYFVNKNTPLIFFHFSGFSPLLPNQISKYQNRYDFTNRNDMVSIFREYRDTLFLNGFEKYLDLRCHYSNKVEPQKQVTNKMKLFPTIRRIVQRVIKLF